jgi:hypothetical protein
MNGIYPKLRAMSNANDLYLLRVMQLNVPTLLYLFFV